MRRHDLTKKTYLPIYLEGTAQITARNCQEPPDNRQEPGTFIFDKQRATLKAKKTCDFWDRWSKWWGNMTWPTIWQYLTMLIIVDNFYSCWYNYDNYWNFLKIFTTKSQQHEQRQWQRQSWDNSDNWETEFMTIFVIWQLIVTLDSIRNSCDVWQICDGNIFPSIFEQFFISQNWNFQIWIINEQKLGLYF